MKTKVFLWMALMALSITTVISQETGKRFGFELSGGASFATRDLDDANLKTGMGFEGILHYRCNNEMGPCRGLCTKQIANTTSPQNTLPPRRQSHWQEASG